MEIWRDGTEEWIDEELSEEEVEALIQEAEDTIHRETDALRAYLAWARARDEAGYVSLEEWARAWDTKEGER